MAGIDSTKFRALVGEGAAIAPTFVRVSDQIQREYTRLIDRATSKLTRIPEDDPRDAEATRLMERLENQEYSADLYDNPRQTGAAKFVKLIAEIDAL
jgi:hypothetical protein